MFFCFIFEGHVSDWTDFSIWICFPTICITKNMTKQKCLNVERLSMIVKQLWTLLIDDFVQEKKEKLQSRILDILLRGQHSWFICFDWLFFHEHIFLDAFFEFFYAIDPYKSAIQLAVRYIMILSGIGRLFVFTFKVWTLFYFVSRAILSNLEMNIFNIFILRY